MAMNDIFFCTIVSRLRVYQAIALFISMQNVMKDYCVYVLCVDDSTYDVLKKMNFKNINLITVNELNDEMLENIKMTRKLNELLLDIKPVLIGKLLFENQFIQRITYIDAICFFGKTHRNYLINMRTAQCFYPRRYHNSNAAIAAHQFSARADGQL